MKSLNQSLYLLFFLCCFLATNANNKLDSNSLLNYQSLDPESPIQFNGNSISYKGKKMNLGPTAFFLDAQLSNEEVNQYPYVFNDFKKAIAATKNGTEADPMTIYIAPYVYWINDPDFNGTVVPKPGEGGPFGMVIRCNNLKLQGLSDNSENVVLASNLGQTMGSKGNFTMFYIDGDGITANNITFGNYCNIDLEYPLKPELNRSKRGSAIVQAQLIICNSDKVYAKNCQFKSRLNLCPFVGSKRTLFENCHFESTDDALNGKAVYLNCTFDFYSGKPFWGTSGTGVAFLNCDVNSLTGGNQYFTKSKGQVAVIDTRFISETSDYIGWRDHPREECRNYQSNVMLNNRPIVINAKQPNRTILMDELPILNAFKFEYEGNTIYNTYNLLKGNDGWDPQQLAEITNKASKASRINYAEIPTQLIIHPSKMTLETGKDTLQITAQLFRFGNFEMPIKDLKWKIKEEDKAYLKLSATDLGTCQIIPTNETDTTRMVLVEASTELGLQASAVVYISPRILEAPSFVKSPKLKFLKNGLINVEYKLDMSYTDESIITWYRCTDKNGANPIEVATSRYKTPKFNYELSVDDLGYYLIAAVSPKHLRCKAGEPMTVVSKKPIELKQIKADANILKVSNTEFAVSNQPKIIPGFWTIDVNKPADTNYFDWVAEPNKPAYYVGSGIYGAANDTGLIQRTKGARLRYTPNQYRSGDMKVTFTACPAKTARQGFSSAKMQYMDIGINFDTENLNGYAIRLIRTTKYGNAIDFVFVKYENGNAHEISDPISTTVYHSPCTIQIEKTGQLFSVKATTEHIRQHESKEVVQEIDMQTEIDEVSFDGFFIQHTGSTGSGASLLKNISLTWKR